MEFMTHLFRFFIFFSSDFTDESEGILAYRIAHGISQNFGRWPMACALYMLLLLFVTQIFLCGDYFVPQISQIYTDFSLWGLFCPTDFTDIHRFFFVGQNFHRISRMNRRHSCLSDYSRNFAELWPLVNGLRPIYAPVAFCHADFSLWGLFRPTDFTDIHRFFFVGIILSHRFHRYTQIFNGISVESLCPLSVGICTDRIGRLRENP